MKKTLVAIFFAALAALFIVLIFKPDLLLAATGEGKLALLDAFSGKMLAENDSLAGSPIDATPAVWENGILAINRTGEMVCFR